MSLENGEGGLVMPTPLSLGPLGIDNSCFYSKSLFSWKTGHAEPAEKVCSWRIFCRGQ